MTRYSWIATSLLCTVLVTQPFAADDSVQQALDSCKSDGQSVSYEMVVIPGKPASEPATPEEEELVKRVLAKSGIPYDRANHRASYDATLAMVRAKQHMRVKIEPAAASAALDDTRKCIQDLIQRSGVSGEVVN